MRVGPLSSFPQVCVRPRAGPAAREIGERGRRSAGGRERANACAADGGEWGWTRARSRREPVRRTVDMLTRRCVHPATSSEHRHPVEVVVAEICGISALARTSLARRSLWRSLSGQRGGHSGWDSALRRCWSLRACSCRSPRRGPFLPHRRHRPRLGRAVRRCFRVSLLRRRACRHGVRTGEASAPAPEVRHGSLQNLPCRTSKSPTKASPRTTSAPNSVMGRASSGLSCASGSR